METLSQLATEDLRRLSPSPFVRRFGEDVVLAAQGKPILDVACGGCRNAILLAFLGANVIGLDIDLQPAHENFKRLTGTVFERGVDRIRLSKCDLLQSPWPYPMESLGGIVNVHFLHLPLIKSFIDSLGMGAFLLIETVGAQGENHTMLPHHGRLRELIVGDLFMVKYLERSAGPPDSNAATVKLAARKVRSSIR
jgi:SAM-dependent methyltransferase